METRYMGETSKCSYTYQFGSMLYEGNVDKTTVVRVKKNISLSNFKFYGLE